MSLETVSALALQSAPSRVKFQSQRQQGGGRPRSHKAFGKRIERRMAGNDRKHLLQILQLLDIRLSQQTPGTPNA